MQQSSILSFLKDSRSQRPEGSSSSEPRDTHPFQDDTSRRGSWRGSERGGRHRRGRGRGRGSSHRSAALREVADETKAKLPNILASLPDFEAADSSIHNLAGLAELDSSQCPSFALSDADPEAGKKGTRIKVFDMDSFEAVLALQPGYTAHTHLSPPSSSSQTALSRLLKPVAVLNLASERSPGGGFHNGALAQEEALCYRSSLYLSLHRQYYPLPPLSAIYSPSVMIIRSAMADGHALLVPDTPTKDLPVASVISLAALRHPKLSDDKTTFADLGARNATKNKIRVILRLAAHAGHTKLVLGAMGCGVFGNPPGEVAQCFLEVFREKEFQGGWWEEVVFAVLDNKKGEEGGTGGVGNFGVFWRGLNGKIV